jgi:hypothetical protein
VTARPIHHWRANWFPVLRGVAQEAAQHESWAEYGRYCEQLERGLRKQALVTLGAFVEQIERAAFVDRRAFVSWLLHHVDGTRAAESLVPHPLRQRVVQPTLAEWLTAEPRCSEPHRWLGGYEHLNEAIQLDPEDEIARRKFVSLVIEQTENAAHELPSGYLGDVEEDLGRLREAERVGLLMTSPEDRRQAIAHVRALRERIEKWVRHGE